MVYKKIILVFLFMFVLFFSGSINAYEINNFDITISVTESHSAKVIEKWVVDFSSETDKMTFKQSIQAANINPSMLEKIDSKIKPKIFINDYSDLKVGFDEINNFVRLEYSISDLVLIKYLDYDNEVIWRFNDNLFRYFVSNNLYNIPSYSYIRIVLKEPFIVGETSPKASLSNNTISWTGISSNELRLIALEKKPPKPTFVIADLFEGFYLSKNFNYFALVLLLLVVTLLVFKKRLSKTIKNFVIKNSKIDSSKKRKDVVDFSEINK